MASPKRRKLRKLARLRRRRPEEAPALEAPVTEAAEIEPPAAAEPVVAAAEPAPPAAEPTEPKARARRRKSAVSDLSEE